MQHTDLRTDRSRAADTNYITHGHGHTRSGQIYFVFVSVFLSPFLCPSVWQLSTQKKLLGDP